MRAKLSQNSEFPKANQRDARHRWPSLMPRKINIV
jgi:hypothetical protein